MNGWSLGRVGRWIQTLSVSIALGCGSTLGLGRKGDPGLWLYGVCYLVFVRGATGADEVVVELGVPELVGRSGRA